MSFFHNIISCLLQLFGCTFYISLISNIINNNSNNIKYKLNVFEILLYSICIILYITTSDTFIIKDLIFTLFLFLIILNVRKLSTIKSAVIAISYTVVHYALLNLISYIVMCCYSISIYQFKTYPYIEGFSVSVASIIMIFITLFIDINLSKKYDIQRIFKSLNYKHILALIIISVFSALPYFAVSHIENTEYINEFYLAIGLNILLLNLLTFLYINKYVKTDNLEKENCELSVDVNSMSTVIDSTRALKHDFNNIFQAIHGYLENKDYEKLNTYVSKLMKECQTINTISLVNKDTFNDQGIYSLVGSKILLATSLQISFEIDCMVDFSKISFDKVNLVRILGILLDNAIEASSNSKEKSIMLECKHDIKKNATIINISNSFNENLSINVKDIFKKGFSTKQIKSGIGLWETKQIINKSSNSQIYTNIKDNIFTQSLIIEDEYEELYELNENNSVTNVLDYEDSISFSN